MDFLFFICCDVCDEYIDNNWMKPRKRVSADEVIFKIIMVGDSGAGKSCLLTRYIKN